jgi:hypothetical protein
MDPDTPGWLFLRLMIMFALGALGIWFGVYVQQKWLRDYFHLVLFGYDDGKDPNRDPLADQVNTPTMISTLPPPHTHTSMSGYSCIYICLLCESLVDIMCRLVL